ncbi:MAG: hypothetical protein ABIL09_19020 [Gemmatimonadota bacterium]
MPATRVVGLVTGVAELSTQAGRAPGGGRLAAGETHHATAHVEDVLSPVGFAVVVTDYATDNCSRCPADLRYLPGELDPQVALKRGRSLNRELLERRLARR